MFPLEAIAETYIGTYEVSYIYNSTTDASNRPVGSAVYNGISTASLKVELAPGSHYIKSSPDESQATIFSIIISDIQIQDI